VCVCVFVCVWLVYVCECECVSVYACICMHVYVCMYMYVNVCMYHLGLRVTQPQLAIVVSPEARHDAGVGQDQSVVVAAADLV
jgi:hypothetical protein